VLLRDIPLRLLLLVVFLLSGLVPMMTASLAAYSSARKELSEQALRQLESVRDIKRTQIERFFSGQTKEVEVLAAGADSGAALEEFRTFFDDPARARRCGLQGRKQGRFEACAEYREIHDRYFAYFSLYARNNDFYDIFLMDPKHGLTYFTVVKEEDFGVTIEHVDSSLRDVWRVARDQRRVAISDTRPYGPSGDIPAQFVAAPVTAGDRLIGVVAVQISLNAIDAIMGERSGMGHTGETYLVGRDFMMRSDSWRHPDTHSVAASFNGTVTENGVETWATRNALAGGVGAGSIAGVAHEEVLSAWAPVDFGGVRWAVVAEISAAEIAEKSRDALNKTITWIIAASVLLVVVLALALSTYFTRGIKRVDSEIGVLIDRVLEGRLSSRADPERVIWDLRGLVRKINDLVISFQQTADETRRLEGVVQYNQRMESIGTLAGGIAHDFNNILTYMTTYGELVEGKLESDSQEARWMEEIMSAVDRAADLVSQIMTFGRQFKKEKHPVEFELIVKEAVKLIRATIPKSISVETEIRHAGLLLLADPTHLHQMVMNLCTNAFQAMQETGGTLTVALDSEILELDNEPHLPPGDYCVLTVSDTGCGMTAETLERVFEPFFTTKPVGQGTGMGLAVVHGLVTHYEGAIRFDSAPRAGTTARIYLPLRETDLPESTARADLSEERGSGVILFVDDEPAICDSVRTTLTELGYEVWTFVEPREALTAFAESPARFDLVVTDVNMPGMNGIELAQHITRLREDVPIIMTTGYNELMSDEEARDHGARSLLRKPYRRGDLARAVKATIKERG